jgi:hypothetical protein
VELLGIRDQGVARAGHVVLPAGELSDTSDGAVEALTIAVKLESTI